MLGDIPASERVGEAWESWSTDRRRAAIRAVLHRVLIRPLPPGANANVAGNSKNTARSFRSAFPNRELDSDPEVFRGLRIEELQ